MGGLTFGEEGIKIWWGQFFKVGGMSKFLAGEEDSYVCIVHIHI